LVFTDPTRSFPPSNLIPTCASSGTNPTIDTSASPLPIQTFWYLITNDIIQIEQGTPLTVQAISTQSDTIALEGKNYKFVYICYHWAYNLYQSLMVDIYFRKSFKIKPFSSTFTGLPRFFSDKTAVPYFPIQMKYQLIILDSSDSSFNSANYLGNHLDWSIRCKSTDTTTLLVDNSTCFVDKKGVLYIADTNDFISVEIMLMNNICQYQGDYIWGSVNNVSECTDNTTHLFNNKDVANYLSRYLYVLTQNLSPLHSSGFKPDLDLSFSTTAYPTWGMPTSSINLFRYYLYGFDNTNSDSFNVCGYNGNVGNTCSSAKTTTDISYPNVSIVTSSLYEITSTNSFFSRLSDLNTKKGLGFILNEHSPDVQPVTFTFWVDYLDASKIATQTYNTGKPKYPSDASYKSFYYFTIPTYYKFFDVGKLFIYKPNTSSSLSPYSSNFYIISNGVSKVYIYAYSKYIRSLSDISSTYIFSVNITTDNSGCISLFTKTTPLTVEAFNFVYFLCSPTGTVPSDIVVQFKLSPTNATIAAANLIPTLTQSFKFLPNNLTNMVK
jgi:hypothetical protein